MFAGRKSFDVFISHRGADVDGNKDKKTFVNFLRARLEQAGIRTFMDEVSIKPGDAAWQVIQDAVRRCRIAVPVLTAGYGSSEWYLQELAIMMDAPRMTAMPLFLDEDGTEVKKKLEAAAEMLASKSGHSPETLAKWQQAIALVASIQGWRCNPTSR